MYDLKRDTDNPLAVFTNDFVEGKLDAVEHAVFEEYLAVNEELSAFVRKSRKGKRALKKAYSVSAANDFEAKLATRIAKEKSLNKMEPASNMDSIY